MKKAIILSVMAAALFSACNNSSTGTATSSTGAGTSSVMDTTKLAKGEVFYQCPMDPQIMSDKPGTCSKCGMDLQKMEKK